MMKFADQWPLASIVKPTPTQLEFPQNELINKEENLKVNPVVAQLQITGNQEDRIVPPVLAQFENLEQQVFARVPWSHHRLLSWYKNCQNN